MDILLKAFELSSMESMCLDTTILRYVDGLQYVERTVYTNEWLFRFDCFFTQNMDMLL